MEKAGIQRRITLAQNLIEIYQILELINDKRTIKKKIEKK